MPRSEKCLLVQYADDTSIVASVSSQSDADHLQLYLAEVEDWTTAQHLRLSTSKSGVMRFTNSKKRDKPSYTAGGAPLTISDHLTILGVTFSRNLDFSAHIATVVATARRTLGFVSRVTRPSGPAALRTLYTALVLPSLEYCCAVWSPPQQHLLDRLESVQRRASRIICARISGHADISYPARLKVLGWRPLDQRRRISRVRVLCHLLDGSLPGNRLSALVRVSKRTGQPQPLRGRTLRHSESLLPAAIRDFLSMPLAARSPLPREPEESQALCRVFAGQMSSSQG
ncbi:uncharacterized protein LOC115330848 [Ixodes scapularis]|uniref:uncharacterized protein LOC115330848 n=1 Tax=Ixodes scapularis TaxID=6945 RepID=UPI001A9FC556|nr:uncharacterized protein LOC115330848 [Ixodes scapularis]